MNPRALEQVEQRLEKAGKAFERLCETNDSDETKEAWSDFLTASGTIYSKLLQGTKENGASAGWFGRKKKERKDDPLLRYVHHARNCDEHGIEDVTSTWTNHNFVGLGDGPFVGIHTPAGGNISNLVGVRHDGKRVPITTYETKTVRLISVKDPKYHDTFDVPSSHLGEQLPATLQPAFVAGLALNYLKDLVEEARALVS